MKRVKVMLFSIAVLASMGGLYSFSAKKAFGKTVFTSTTTINGCGVRNTNSTITDTPSGTSYYWSSEEGGECSLEKKYLKVEN